MRVLPSAAAAGAVAILMVKVTLGRQAKMHGTSIGNEMGLNTWAAFAGDDDNAVVDGDFAMREDELQPVLKAILWQQRAWMLEAAHTLR